MRTRVAGLSDIGGCVFVFITVLPPAQRNGWRLDLQYVLLFAGTFEFAQLIRLIFISLPLPLNTCCDSNNNSEDEDTPSVDDSGDTLASGSSSLTTKVGLLLSVGLAVTNIGASLLTAGSSAAV